MFIAFTSMLHAALAKHEIEYIEYNADGTQKQVGGKPLLWDCLYSFNYYRNNLAPKGNRKYLDRVYENLRLLIPLKHDFEHRETALFDELIAGHCQSMLHNFENILQQEFGSYYALNNSLALAIQFSSGRSSQTDETIRARQSAQYGQLRQYISDFHKELPADIAGDSAFAFRVWLIQKPAKHANASDISIEYVYIDPDNPDQMRALEQSIVAITKVTRSVVNADLMRPGKVVPKVSAALGRQFTMHHHTLAWRHYEVRPQTGAADSAKTNNKYCSYDALSCQYAYTQEWVDFLISEFANESKFKTVCCPDPERSE